MMKMNVCVCVIMMKMSVCVCDYDEYVCVCVYVCDEYVYVCSRWMTENSGKNEDTHSSLVSDIYEDCNAAYC